MLLSGGGKEAFCLLSLQQSPAMPWPAPVAGGACRPHPWVKHRGFWPFGQKLAYRSPLLSSNRSRRRLLQGRFWETARDLLPCSLDPASNILWQSGPRGPSRLFLGKQPVTYCCAHWIWPLVVIYMVAVRRQDGKERSEPVQLQKSLLIQQAFPPLYRFLPFFTFAFPLSQWTAGARLSTHGGINEGFPLASGNLAGIHQT